MKGFIQHKIYWFIHGTAKNRLKEELVWAKWASFILLSVLQFINFSTILTILQLYTNYDAIIESFHQHLPKGASKYSFESYFYSLLTLSPFIVLNYFICHKTTQQDVEAYFASMSKKKKTISAIYFTAYIILTFVVAIYFIEKKHDRDRNQEKETQKPQTPTYYQRLK